MISAIFKAFTGRAGLLSSVLALLITALVVMAAMKGLPRIEQRILTASQAVLEPGQVNTEGTPGMHVEGRDIYLKGEQQQIQTLKTKLVQIDGVRRVSLDENAAPDSADIAPQDQYETEKTQKETSLVQQAVKKVIAADESSSDQPAIAPQNQDEADQTQKETGLVQQAVKKVSENIIADSSSDQGTIALQDQANADVSSEIIYDQSSLLLRYDGTQLQLNGHLANDEAVQFIADRIKRVVPTDSTLQTSLDSKGAPSSLRWMNQFLDTVAGLPDDAQGVIKGSDKDGVQIYPDAEQTLIKDDKPDEAIDDQEISLTTTPETDSSINNKLTVDTQKSADTSDAMVLKAQSDTGAGDNSGLTKQKAPPSSKSAIKATAVDTADGEVNQPSDMAEIIEENARTETPAQIVDQDSHPAEFILDLNNRFAVQHIFPAGESKIDSALARELDALADMMNNHTSLLLRIVGNLDFSVDPRDAAYVGIDRAREIRDYLRSKNVDSFRVFAAPLPRDYAFDQRVQVIFYVSE